MKGNHDFKSHHRPTLYFRGGLWAWQISGSCLLSVGGGQAVQQG